MGHLLEEESIFPELPFGGYFLSTSELAMDSREITAVRPHLALTLSHRNVNAFNCSTFHMTYFVPFKSNHSFRKKGWRPPWTCHAVKITRTGQQPSRDRTTINNLAVLQASCPSTGSCASVFGVNVSDTIVSKRWYTYADHCVQVQNFASG